MASKAPESGDTCLPALSRQGHVSATPRLNQSSFSSVLSVTPKGAGSYAMSCRCPAGNVPFARAKRVGERKGADTLARDPAGSRPPQRRVRGRSAGASTSLTTQCESGRNATKSHNWPTEPLRADCEKGDRKDRAVPVRFGHSRQAAVTAGTHRAQPASSGHSREPTTTPNIERPIHQKKSMRDNYRCDTPASETVKLVAGVKARFSIY